MAVAGGVFCANGFICVLELSRIPSLPCLPLNIHHGDEDDGIIFDNDAVSLGFIGLDSELLNRVYELATDVK